MTLLYKHPNNTDVAFEVLKKFYIKEKDAWSLKIRWWNVVGERVEGREPECLWITERIKISNKKFREFKPMRIGK